jgi:hypothetical protein
MLSQLKRQSGALDSREPPLSMPAQNTILAKASAESWQNRRRGECPQDSTGSMAGTGIARPENAN